MYNIRSNKKRFIHGGDYMVDNRNIALVKKFEQYLEDGDMEVVKAELPKFLSNFTKVSKRMDRIISQSDNQQLQVVKLTDSLKETNDKIQDLLNNAGQGFLYFDKDMIIGAEYSKEAVRIFDKEIKDQDISILLYSDDENDAMFFKATLQAILEDEPMRQEILISLLQQEFKINDAFIEVEYKVLSEDSFMMILTDITATKKLAQEIKDRQQVLKMVVETVTTIEQFISVKSDYEKFISQIDSFKSLELLSPLRKEIHTYKGLFAQKEMLNIVKELHEFESLIDTSLKNNVIDDVIKNITNEDMYAWLESDIKVLKEILGNNFFDQSNSISVDKNRIDKLYDMVIEYLKSKNTENLVHLGKELIQLKYSNIDVFLKPYEKLVAQLSLRLEKNINPLTVNSEEIYISDKYKPFLNSLVHIFRNSVDHGIESLEKREELGKSYEGTITCDVKKDAENLLIKISDDGQGIDEEKIKSLAVSKQIYTQEEADLLTQEEILLIIFQDSFTTNKNVTDISGRGVGLASVLKELESLNGTMEIKNNFGHGIEFIFKMPFETSTGDDNE